MATTTYTRPRPSGRGLLEVSTVDTSAGAGDAGKIPSLNGSGQIDPSFIPGSADFTANATETLAAGDFVNIHDNAGTVEVRLADATNGRDAHGYVTAAVTAGNPATVYSGSVNDQLTGLTLGVPYYLGAAGAVTTTANTTSGQLRQYLGRSVAATSILVEVDTPIEIA